MGTIDVPSVRELDHDGPDRASELRLAHVKWIETRAVLLDNKRVRVSRMIFQSREKVFCLMLDQGVKI